MKVTQFGPRRRPRVAAVLEGEVLVVDVDALEVVVGGEARRWRRRARPVDSGSASNRRHHARVPCGRQTRGDERDAASRGPRRRTRRRLLARGVGVRAGSSSTPGDLVPERRDLVEHVGAGLEVVERRFSRSQRRHPGVDVERPGLVARLGVADGEPPDAAGDEEDGDGAERRPNSRRAGDRRAAAAAGDGERAAAAPLARRATVASGGGGVRSMYSPRSSGVTPCSVDSTTRCGAAGIGRRLRHGDDDAAGRLGGGDAGRRVLDGDARQRIDAELLGGPSVGLGVRLAVHHHVAGDHGLERAAAGAAGRPRR